MYVSPPTGIRLSAHGRETEGTWETDWETDRETEETDRETEETDPGRHMGDICTWETGRETYVSNLCLSTAYRWETEETEETDNPQRQRGASMQMVIPDHMMKRRG